MSELAIGESAPVDEIRGSTAGNAALGLLSETLSRPVQT